MAEEITKEEYQERFLNIIQKYSGLTVSSSHRNFMLNFISKRKDELDVNDEEYCRKLEDDILERNLVIDEAAINETYFFREECQFDFLRDSFFPKHKDAVIWSAACSTGEEAISLYALAKACNVNAKVYASDIDEKALSIFKNCKYAPHSFRNEGSPYLNLLEQLGTYYPKSFTMSQETLSNISISRFNLASDEVFPMEDESVDLLFLRNVFIYFTSDTRKAVLMKMARAMKMHSLLFLSINEIASVECDIDLPFIKENTGPVFYLKKVSHEEKLNAARVREHIITLKKPSNHVLNSAPKSRTVIEIPRSREKSQPQCSIPELYKELKASVNSRDIEHAKELLSSYKFKPVEMEHELYIKGLIYEAEGKSKEALDSYQRASILNPKFWPATYSLAILYKKQGNTKNMKKAFLSCTNALKTYIQNHEICYNDIVDSFSPDYFLELCESQLEGER
ncbi:MAG: hypothetical protein J5857_11420 [Treponema sp.]|nr:hypothetical protein [Treponema sp.]